MGLDNWFEDAYKAFVDGKMVQRGAISIRKRLLQGGDWRAPGPNPRYLLDWLSGKGPPALNLLETDAYELCHFFNDIDSRALGVALLWKHSKENPGVKGHSLGLSLFSC